MATLKQPTIILLALLTLSLGFPGCGSKNQPSQNEIKSSFVSE